METSGPILVTGAAGFVGACICHHFAGRGRRVVAVARPSAVSWRLASLPADVEVVRADLARADEVQGLLRDVRPEIVVHCAAYGAYPNQTNADRIYQVNFEAVRYMLEAASQVPGFRAFIQAGSSSEYGFNCTAPAEDATTRPDSEYAVSKVAATALVQYFGEKRRLPAWVFRLYSVYGPFEDSSRLIPRLLACAEEQRFPNLANPLTSRDFVFVDDVCAAVDALIARAPDLAPGGIFNIGSGRGTTLEQIVARVREQFGIEHEPVWGSMPDRTWDHRDWRADPRKAETILGWRATTSLAEGLAATARWRAENAPTLRTAEENSVVRGP